MQQQGDRPDAGIIARPHVGGSILEHAQKRGATLRMDVRVAYVHAGAASLVILYSVGRAPSPRESSWTLR